MTRPASPPAGPTFDLPAVDRDLRREDAYRRDGHTARTLVRAPDLRIVLVVMPEHRAAETVSIHAVSGHIRLRVADETVDLPTGRLLVLEGGVSHDVEAIQESAFLLTLGWKGSGGS
jgi:hypothetical protein